MQHAAELMQEIDAAYRELAAMVEDLAHADYRLSEHARRVKLENAEALLAAKNERTATLYLEGLLDTEEHQKLARKKEQAELKHQLARREVERLHLVVRLLSAPIPGAQGAGVSSS